MTNNIRAALAADPDLGAGNVLPKLTEHGAEPGRPTLTFDVAVDGTPAWTALDLRTLTERVAARADWFHRRGVRPRDPVAVYTTCAPDVLLNAYALMWLGAIPALLNGKMPIGIAAEYIRRLRASAVVLDPDHAELRGHELGAPILGEAAETGTGDPARAPEHYRHHRDDPIAITHSSGTTRIPAAAVHSHFTLFAAIRALRLAQPRARGEVRELSVMPAAHAAGLVTVNQSLCNGYELLFLSAQGGEFEHSGATILDAIERWRPTGVFGFAVTWSELARHDLTRRDLSSVRNWNSTGDCAHETHVRKLVAVGSHPVYTRGGVVQAPGSKFIDMHGSTEMGHSAFQMIHTADSDRYDRCAGKTHPFAEVVLLDRATGTPVADGEVGHVGLKSPTLALGYWNDSAATYRDRLDGYYLTGDLMYRDAEGYYYHVDRAVDAIDLGGGERLYTALSEERILTQCPDVRDCTVLAAREDDGTVVTDVLLQLAEGADPAVDRTPQVRAALGEAAARTLRRVAAVPDDGVVTGPTGKVRKFLMRRELLADPDRAGRDGRRGAASSNSSAVSSTRP